MIASRGLALGVLGLMVLLWVGTAAAAPNIGILGKIGSTLGKLQQAFDVRGNLAVSCGAISPDVVLSTTTRTVDLCVSSDSLLAWDTTKGTTKQTAANIERLRRDVARLWGPLGNKTYSGTLCLRCVVSPEESSASPPTFPPEGKVWRVDGDLVLQNPIFKGKGTIIVNGNLTVEGDAKYDDTGTSASSVGFIVRGTLGNNGTIIFKPGTSTNQKVVGAYLATGQAFLNPPGVCLTVPFDLTGSLVASKFDLSGRKITC
ncbi:hypothetical protein HY065_00330 [Candidatus Berkelbacteria bacterium]|nr:hypothetical protein [Candidatus Berkelbacteria bacterium]